MGLVTTCVAKGLIVSGLGRSDKAMFLYNFFTATRQNPIYLKFDPNSFSLSNIPGGELTGCKDAMDLSKLPIFALMGRRMSWLAQRQTILAHNVSNADTPKFRPLDLTKESFRKMVDGATSPTVTMRQTSTSHILPTRQPDPFRKDKSKDSYETAMSGNSVVLEEQLMKVAETQGAYNLATNLYRKHVKMLKMAIGQER